MNLKTALNTLKLIIGYGLIVFAMKQAIPLTYSVDGTITLETCQAIYYWRLIPAFTSLGILFCGVWLVKANNSLRHDQSE